MNQGAVDVVVAVLVVALWVVMLLDWRAHAHKRRYVWLVLILVTGVIGYIFFAFSKDRT